jgi:hypothetical protein
MKKPYLVITDPKTGRGTCSACSDEVFESTAIARGQSEEVLQALFEAHFKTIHMRQEASRAAARIASEATGE